MQKRDTVKDKKAKKSNAEVYKCGDCLHYQRHAHSGKGGEVCANQGVRAFATAPKCFTPDVSVLQGNTDVFLQAALIINSYTPKQRRIMLAVLRDASKVKKKGYTIGTKVYFKIAPGDYLNNYCFGYVMGRTSAGEIMVQGSVDRKTRGDSFMFYVKDDSALMSSSDWKVHEQKLRDEGKINDPVLRRNRVKKSEEDDYEVPSLDAVPASWWDKTKEPKKRSKNQRRTNEEFQVS